MYSLDAYIYNIDTYFERMCTKINNFFKGFQNFFNSDSMQYIVNKDLDSCFRLEEMQNYGK